jgi:hypothetical protein
MGLKDVIIEDILDATGIGRAGAIEAEAHPVQEETFGPKIGPYDSPPERAVKGGNGNGKKARETVKLTEPVIDQRGRGTPPQATRKQDASILAGTRLLILIFVDLIAIMFLGFMVVSLNPAALQLVIFLPSMASVFLFCGLFAFVWITRKVSIPYFSAWRKGWFIRIAFSGNDALFRPQEYGSGVIYSADGELKSYLKRGVDLFRCGSVDLCPVVDECGLTGDPVYVAALGTLYAQGLKTYAEVRKAYKAGVLKDDTMIVVPDPVVVPFRLLKNYIMGAPTSSLLYAHTDYQAEKKYRLRAGLFGEKKGMAMSIIMVCIGIAIIIFALSMAGVPIFGGK